MYDCSNAFRERNAVILQAMNISQTLQLYKKRYMVRSKIDDSSADSTKSLRAFSQLRDAVSKKWHGTQDAVNEIREQRGGSL